VFLIAYFGLQLHFRLPEKGNRQVHGLEIFNAYYKEVLGQKMNKKLGSSRIYLTEEQYSQVNVSKSFYIQCSILVFT
jgi:hypothetical protein